MTFIRKNPELVTIWAALSLIFIGDMLVMVSIALNGISLMLFEGAAVLSLGGLLFSYRHYTQSRRIEVRLGKPAYSFDEVIAGEVVLNLEKDMPACGLTVHLYGKKKNGLFWVQFCRAELLLAEARVYLKGETFPFLLPIPRNALPDASKGQQPTAGVKWFVEAQLDIHNDVDMVRREAVVLQASPAEKKVQAQAR